MSDLEVVEVRSTETRSDSSEEEGEFMSPKPDGEETIEEAEMDTVMEDALLIKPPQAHAAQRKSKKKDRDRHRDDSKHRDRDRRKHKDRDRNRDKDRTEERRHREREDFREKKERARKEEGREEKGESAKDEERRLKNDQKIDRRSKDELRSEKDKRSKDRREKDRDDRKRLRGLEELNSRREREESLHERERLERLEREQRMRERLLRAERERRREQEQEKRQRNKKRREEKVSREREDEDDIRNRSRSHSREREQRRDAEQGVGCESDATGGMPSSSPEKMIEIFDSPERSPTPLGDEVGDHVDDAGSEDGELPQDQYMEVVEGMSEQDEQPKKRRRKKKKHREPSDAEAEEEVQPVSVSEEDAARESEGETSDASTNTDSSDSDSDSSGESKVSEAEKKGSEKEASPRSSAGAEVAHKFYTDESEGSLSLSDREDDDDQQDVLEAETPPPSPVELRPELPDYYPAIQGCRSVEEFNCLNRIEEGTYGVVYRARDKKTEEIVALKRLKMEKEKEGFPITSLREINTLLKAQHSNIVTVREIVVGSNMDKIYIVMDYVEHDLKGLMESMKQPFLVGEVKTLLIQLLRAVAHLHDNWILHRDLKTSNLLLSHKGILKVGDFGLAREYGSPLKQYTPIVVTLWYRAPELLLGTKTYSTPIDMWSVGCIFAEFLTMKPLFPGKSEIDQLNRIFKELGTPSEKIWPGYSELPAVKKVTFANHPYNALRNKFGSYLSDHGFDLINRFLTYDPKRRISSDEALKHAYLKESPLPVDPSMFPTWPAKSEQMPRKRGSSPPPPSGGKLFKDLGAGEDLPSGGFHLPVATHGVSKQSIGFNLKF
ncbi:PREDICTED: cyclin-dependent kinase 11A-like isoform X2 [Priapulus caudatus]|uniref:Cyclin-dependent kinase 11A-like isoform X2 n=1 Tax=Priapulus caudatus TaxID=37621 RepID=A0ABM1DPB5_PRICU|nr:PREDICTED: cyclin-dependent kinase 11A-like isoform X2 [Priapulus caudatus]XP_014661786.1 PREDICTED: cyclin-dependent kinase 11A-like isoform X2 [Priapulus caudatus]